ncbi:MAG: DNA polymerase IV [Alphaproteobacteria bacterium]|nr:DNA polymerase IV [Alphaproteobacteria bacterium]
MSERTPILCRDCLAQPNMPKDGRCPKCGSPRLITHPELHSLTIAHIDCDAFYASVEKRDNPALANRPVIVGGGRRGVVAAACYVARVYGVRSAMPMFKALQACPDAVVIRPDMAKYSAAGRQVRELMLGVTPLVEPLSIDEAFLDLGGTEKVHGGSPARTLARLILEIEQKIGVSASIGLSHNKFLAKTASDLDKPRGFAVIGKAETLDFLAPRPVGAIYGVGRALEARLQRDGIATIGELRQVEETVLYRRYGAMGQRLYKLSRGIDDRKVDPSEQIKSISSETTFMEDIADLATLSREVWPLCEKVAQRLKKNGLAGKRVTLKLKTADFKQLTRSRTMDVPLRPAEEIYRAVMPLLEKEADGRAFRLIGAGVEELCDADAAAQPDLLDPGAKKRADVEKAIDSVRDKLGDKSIIKGREL